MRLKGKSVRQVKKLSTKQRNLIITRGNNSFKDIAHCFAGYSFNVIFDVGANVGQSAEVYLEKFSNSHIYCFEPVSSTFDKLRENLKASQRIDFYNIALGSSNRTGQMVLQGESDMFFMQGQSNALVENDDVQTESVDVVKLDDFCDAHKVAHIDFLKVDAEGGDLDVLEGAAKMLSEQRINLIQVEAGMNPANRRHVPLELLKAFLESHKYFIFGIYEQMFEWPTGEPHLRRTNPIFISQKMIEESRSMTRSFL